jgi:hypothetical protein
MYASPSRHLGILKQFHAWKESLRAQGKGVRNSHLDGTQVAQTLLTKAAVGAVLASRTVLHVQAIVSVLCMRPLRAYGALGICVYDSCIGVDSFLDSMHARIHTLNAQHNALHQQRCI